jgi:deoxycytidylate deaminase
MHAIIIGSQLSSDRMIGGKLFCTTFPCHNCGRHIILSGIQEIYYIEPYVKSLCLELHEDSMTDDESDSEETRNKVKILMYDGVAPRRYLEFFSMKEKRKLSDGKYISIDYKKAMPKNRMSLQALPTLEEQALHSLELQHFGI